MKPGLYIKLKDQLKKLPDDNQEQLDTVEHDLKEHVENEVIHVTTDDKSKWNEFSEHINDSDVHIEPSLKSKLTEHSDNTDVHFDNLEHKKSLTDHVSNSDLHFDNKAHKNRVDDHISNDGIHTTIAEKNSYALKSEVINNNQNIQVILGQNEMIGCIMQAMHPDIFTKKVTGWRWTTNGLAPFDPYNRSIQLNLRHSSFVYKPVPSSIVEPLKTEYYLLKSVTIYKASTMEVADDVCVSIINGGYSPFIIQIDITENTVLESSYYFDFTYELNFNYFAGIIEDDDTGSEDDGETEETLTRAYSYTVIEGDQGDLKTIDYDDIEVISSDYELSRIAINADSEVIPDTVYRVNPYTDHKFTWNIRGSVATGSTYSFTLTFTKITT